MCRSSGSLSECVCTGESGGAAGDGRGGGTSGTAGTTPSSGGTGGAASGNGGAGDGGDGASGDGGEPSQGGEAGRGDAGAPMGGAGGGAGGAGGVGGPCGPADVGGCRCPDDALGYRLCVAGRFGPCACDGGTGGVAGGGVGTCQPTAEICDQMDNDCNGIVDNGFPCPDDSVQNTSPFTGGAYLQGTLQEGIAGYEALQQFWPTLEADYITGFDSYADYYRFSRLDGTIFYYATFSGVFRNGVSETPDDDTLLSTTPCDDSLSSITDFNLDATGTLYYACRQVLYRGDAEIVAGTFSAIAGVLDDGRIVVTRGGQFAVLNAQGRELSRFPPPTLFAGSLSVIPSATTIQDNRAYIAFGRTYLPNEREVVVYRIDPDSTFRLVRRARNAGVGLVLSDGTLFARVSGSDNERIVGYFPDNTSRDVWREAEATTVRAHIGDQILVGPRLP